MSDEILIRSLSQDDWLTYKTIRLRALEDSPDAFGSTLEREQAFSDFRWVSRLSAGEDSWDLPLLAEVGGQPAGLAWGRIERSDPSLGHLYQMWVAPEYRRLGIAKKLLDEVITWARDRQAVVLELGVTCGNSPAQNLYIRTGFEPFGLPEPLRPGSELLFQTMHLKL